MTTQENISNTAKKFKTIGLVTYFGYTAICVFAINGTRGFIPSFLQFASILLIMEIMILSFLIGCCSVTQTSFPIFIQRLKA
jgi:hypothetical protein